MDHDWKPTDPEPDEAPGSLIDQTSTSGSAPATDTPSAPASKPRGLRRLLATFGLALGLLTIGGASVVMAASPAPSSTPSASGGTTTPSTKHNCPNMGSHSGSTTSPGASQTN